MTARVKQIEGVEHFEFFDSDLKKRISACHLFERNRASSLALPTDCLVELLEKSQKTPEKTSESLQVNTASPINNARRHSSASHLQTELNAPNAKERKPPNCLALAPPPLPPRKFPGKFQKGSKKEALPNSKTNIRSKTSKALSKSLSDAADNKLENDLCSISFDDIGDSDDLVIFDKKSQLIDPNQSSSDSSRSQTTIDTGYISAFDTDRSSVTTNQRQFRGRFSSEDTQSSLDSYLSSDLQRADTVESLQSNFTDSPFNLKKNVNVFNFDQSRLIKKISSSGSIDSDNNRSITPIKTHAMRRLPAVPARKGIRQRTPPAPPLRASQLAESSESLLDANRLLMINNNKLLSTVRARDSSLNISRADENANKPPPLSQIHHSKINQRQDSNISSDSMMSSPGYNTKTMDAPLLQNASRMNKSKIIHQQNTDSFIMSNLSRSASRGAHSSKRLDSSLSNESFTQTSSLNSKLKEAPLLAHNVVKLHTYKQPYKTPDEILKDSSVEPNNSSASIIKSASTPASLQTIVRFSNGSNMSLQHKILRVRKNSNPYVTRGRLRFRLCQILLNALALLIIAGGLAAYFNAYPTIKFVNKTISVPTQMDSADTINADPNPARGVCLPVILKFCQNHKLPYNYTVFPNYIGHFGQLEAQVELEQFDALVDVQCFELVPLYLCSLFVPKCSSVGKPVPPCKNLCVETMRRCGFFFNVFGLELPEYLSCKLFSDSSNPEECVGGKEMKELKTRKPVCNEFSCDKKRCIPFRYVCDGVVDCFDQADELRCSACNSSSIHCGERKCMSDNHICDGSTTCPYGQDERNCIRLSSTNGDLGKGTVEVYRAGKKRWEPACIKHWVKESPTLVCSALGYASVNSSRLVLRGTNHSALSNQDATAWMRMSQKKSGNILKEHVNCLQEKKTQMVAELTCTNFECGKVRTNRKRLGTKRIIGGNESNPGDWPFLAAILGGPEEIFYCAGVLIADQWVLTASHCIGNHTLRNLNDWTIQLGMTRRHSHAHYGQKIKVKKVIPHPQYNDIVAHDNDIALFQLATRVAFHDHLLPVCLPPDMKELPAGTNCTVIGWGKKEDKNSNPNSMHTAYEPAINEVVVPVLNRDLCNEWLDTLNVTEGMICAGYETGGFDACQGDSGGPLLCPYPNERDRWFVGGIVSWGIMCAHPRLPGVYANVPKYIPWILSQMNNHTSKFADSHGGG